MIIRTILIYIIKDIAFSIYEITSFYCSFYKSVVLYEKPIKIKTLEGVAELLDSKLTEQQHRRKKKALKRVASCAWNNNNNYY